MGIDDSTLLKGAGTFEVAASIHLMNKIRKDVEGKVKLGVDCFAQALLCIPKILAENGGYDPQEVAMLLHCEQEKGRQLGLDITTGKPVDAGKMGIYENSCVKKQIIMSATVISSQLLLVDSIVCARSESVRTNECATA